NLLLIGAKLRLDPLQAGIGWRLRWKRGPYGDRSLLRPGCRGCGLWNWWRRFLAGGGEGLDLGGKGVELAARGGEFRVQLVAGNCQLRGLAACPRQVHQAECAGTNKQPN